MKFLWIGLFLFLGNNLLGQVTDSIAFAQQVDSLIRLCVDLTGKKQFEAAKQEIVHAERMVLDHFGTNHKTFARVQFEYAFLLNASGNTADAEQRYLQAKEIQEKVLGKEHPEYAKTLNNLGNLYKNKGDFAKSEPLHLEAKAIRERILGKEHPDYSQSLLNLGNLYLDNGMYDKAEPFYLEALSIREKLIGKENPDYARVLNNLGALYKEKGDYEKAEAAVEEALGIRAKVLGKDHPIYARTLFNLANIYLGKGNYARAEQMFSEGLLIQEKAIGKTHPDYAIYLRSLVGMYMGKEDFAKAEPLLLKSHDILANAPSKYGREYAQTMNFAGAYYFEIGDLGKAEAFYSAGLKILEQQGGKMHPDYASGLSNLGRVYRATGEFEKARSAQLEALSILEQSVGKRHKSYAYCLLSLGTLCFDTNQFDQVEQYYLEALDIIGGLLGKDCLDYALVINNLANFYCFRGEYSKAYPLLQVSLGIREQKMGVLHPYYARTLINFGKYYWGTGDLEKAAAFISRTIPICQTAFENVTSYQSEQQTLLFESSIREELNFALSFTCAFPSDTLLAAVYDNALYFNNALLDAAIARENGISKADSLTQATHAAWKSCHYQLNNWYQQTIAASDSAIVARLEQKAEQLEKELTRSSPSFANSRIKVHWNEIRDRLQPGQAALEFIRFRLYDVRGVASDSILYAALLLHPGDRAPAFIPLCEEKQIKDVLEPVERAGDRKYFAETYRKLYSLLWQNIEPKLFPADTEIFYAPTGELHKINLEGLYDANLRFLADRYHLVRLSSTRQIVTRQPVNKMLDKPLTAVVYGGIRYEADSVALQKAASSAATIAGASLGLKSTFLADSLLTRGGNSRLDSFVSLPQTLIEAQEVYGLLRERGFNVDLRTGFDANETYFKQLGDKVPAPLVLHIATHGFFFPNPGINKKNSAFKAANEDLPFKIHEHPMMRGGLALAGANRTWVQHRPFAGMEDGVLTAYEISRLDLSGTELAVFSACETNLGDIAGTEGVFGLQRALKIAGAHRLIMSLWEVPSAQTQMLFSQFYKNWLLKGLDITSAFRAAQKSMRKQFPNPFFWAGFVLIGDGQ